MIEYLTAGIAVHFAKRFNMTLHSAAFPVHGDLLRCNISLLRCRKANPRASGPRSDNARRQLGFQSVGKSAVGRTGGHRFRRAWFVLRLSGMTFAVSPALRRNA